MTDLQASLIAIGGVIVVGVIFYNKWQERKAKKSVERAFSSSHDDVLMAPDVGFARTASERTEPTFASDEPKPAGPATDRYSAVEYGEETEIFDLAAISQTDLPVDALIDCDIPLALEGPARGDKILPILQSLRHVGNKPVHFMGQGLHGDWEPVTHGGVYTALQAGVQLANRNSALNELEYSELVMRLRQVADELNAEPDVPDMIEVMSAARELHEFVTEYDARLGVNVQSNGAPWAISTLLAALERQGFDLRPEGRLVMPDGEGGTLFSLSTNVTLAAETTARLTLLLDVPCVSPAGDGFGSMVACARSLASRLDGTVVDDANQPLSSAALGEIEAQVNAFYIDMEAAGIPAGSPRALRLFS